VISRRVVIEGRVQGVGFRYACAREATAAGLVGSVRNLPDGRVEAIFEGREEQVDALVAWCRRGPTSARVRGVRVSDGVATGVTDFRIG
jgi:acylphosphatase